MMDQNKSSGRFGKVLLVIFLILLSAAVGYLAGAIREATRATSFNHAEYALKKTGLSRKYAPSFSLYGFTGFRDTFSVTQLLIDDADDRKSLFQEMIYAKGWHTENVTPSEFQAFANVALWSYGNIIQLPEKVTFDAWYYLQTTEPASFSPMAPDSPFSSIGQIGYGFEFAVYDLDTGLMLFIDQFG